MKKNYKLEFSSASLSTWNDRMLEKWNDVMVPPGKITNYKIQITNKEVPFGQINAYGEDGWEGIPYYQQFVEFPGHQITKIRGVLRIYIKLSIVNCQLLIVNEISTRGLLLNLNYKKITKGSHGLHRGSFTLQTMTALIKSFCGGVQGGRFFQKAPPLAAGGK